MLFLLTPCKKTKISLDSFQRYWYQRIVLSDWMRGKTGHTQPKVVVSDANFGNCLYAKILKIDWFLWEILMIKEYHNLIGWGLFRLFFPDMEFWRIIKNTLLHHFLFKKDINGLNVGKTQRQHSFGVFGLFLQKDNISEKFGFVNFWTLRPSNFMWNFR